MRSSASGQQWGMHFFRTFATIQSNGRQEGLFAPAEEIITRPAISAPKQLSNQSTTAPPTSQGHLPVNGLSEKPANVGKERPGRPGGNTADLVKRRYSTRFAHLPDFNNADVPPVPNGHLANHNPQLNQPVPGHPQSINVDVAALKDPSLDPEKCRHCP